MTTALFDTSEQLGGTEHYSARQYADRRARSLFVGPATLRCSSGGGSSAWTIRSAYVAPSQIRSNLEAPARVGAGWRRAGHTKGGHGREQLVVLERVVA